MNGLSPVGCAAPVDAPLVDDRPDHRHTEPHRSFGMRSAGAGPVGVRAVVGR